MLAEPTDAPPNAPLALALAAFNEGDTAVVRVTLANASSKALAPVEMRAPVPPGMAFVDATPPAQEYEMEVGWSIAEVAPEETLSLRYRLTTHGLAAEAAARATVGDETYTSAAFPIGSPASPPKVGPIPAVAAVPTGPRRAPAPLSAIGGLPWRRLLLAFLVGGLVATVARRLRRKKRRRGTSD